MPLPWGSLEAGLDHFPFGGVDHDRHARDVPVRRNQIEVR